MLDKNINDKDLIVAVKKNDHDAFKKLYLEYFQMLIRFAWYRVHSVDIAKELVQELFIRVWSSRENLDPEKSIKAYLYKALGNLIINHLKLRSSNNISLDNNDDYLEPSKNENIDLQIDIRNAIDSLPEKMKSVYMLSRYDGFSYDEIAEICNISKKAVEKRMSKAFVLLRKKIL
jgi:RNA polymerase sigma-70 factor, ECF subfamily